MSWSRAILVLLLATLVGCSSGGSGIASVPSSPWPRFRHDTAHTGAGIGRVGGTRTTPLAIAVDAEAPLSPVVASPVLGIDGSAYVLSTAGTLAAITNKGEVRWRTQTCEICPQESRSIGTTFSSPTVHAPPSGPAVVYFGSDSGRVFGFEDRQDRAVCTLCFDATRQGAGFAVVRFLAPPTLFTHVATGKVTQILAPAAVRRTPSGTEEGLLFSLSTSGDLLWTYPRTAGYPSPFVTAVAFGVGSTAFVGSADGWLHAVNVLLGGEPAWRAFVGPFTDLDTPVSLAPITSSTAVFAYSTTGRVVAFSPTSGAVLWQRDLSSTPIAASLALGIQASAIEVPTATAGPEPSATPTSGVSPTPTLLGDASFTPSFTPSPTSTPTPTPTATPLTLASSLFGLSKDGRFFVLDARDGNDVPTSDVQEAIDGEVLSSPALSLDAYLVFGSSQGSLYAIHNSSGLSAWPPISLAPGVPLRSSPAIASDGTIWIGADNGYVYRVGGQ
ncbi:Desiccation/radiation resistance protein [bacterium HR30]|nr:Desiccation/radiation resistance protein [bacterium HR30]